MLMMVGRGINDPCFLFRTRLMGQPPSWILPASVSEGKRPLEGLIPAFRHTRLEVSRVTLITCQD